jgi:hypothetical protein
MTQALDDKELSVLKAIVHGGFTPGSKALRQSRVEPEQFVDAIRRLKDLGYIDASGNLDDPIYIQAAVMSPRPTRQSEISELLERG